MKTDFTIQMITMNYNLCLDQIRFKFITKEAGVKAYKDYAEAIKRVYTVSKEFERLYNIDLKRLENM